MSVCLSDVISLDDVQPSVPMPFMHRVINDRVLISNDLGDYHFLDPADFKRFIEGDLEKGDELYETLAAKNFIAAEVDIAEQARRFARKKGFLAYGPTLHAFVLTERCNHGCQYCHSSVVGMSRFDTETHNRADRAVRRISSVRHDRFDKNRRSPPPGALFRWCILRHSQVKAASRPERAA